MKTVLVVDDEFDVVESIQAFLEVEGYRVVTAMDGKGALERMRQEPPDMVLLDVMLPGMSGLEVVERMRQEEGLKATPVALMSVARPRTGPSAPAWSAFLQKPFRAEALLRTVERLTS